MPVNCIVFYNVVCQLFLNKAVFKRYKKQTKKIKQTKNKNDG